MRTQLARGGLAALHLPAERGDQLVLPGLFEGRSQPPPLRVPPARPCAQRYANRCHIWYTLDKAPEGGGWAGSVGHISEEMLQAGASSGSGRRGGPRLEVGSGLLAGGCWGMTAQW